MRFYQRPSAQLIAFLFLAVMGAVGLFRLEGTINDQEQGVSALAKEGAVREDQFCLLTERDHRQDVRSLRSIYGYLGSLSSEEAQTPFNRLILREVPRSEREARTDTAPPLCDKPGRFGDKNVGLPEPDPKVPKRPAKVDALLER